MFLFSLKFWLNMLGSNLGSLCVSVCVRLCVCLCIYSLNGWLDFYENFHKWSDRYLQGLFFSDFRNSKLMTSWRPFCTFSMRHSHGRIFFVRFSWKFMRRYKLPVFAIENRQNGSLTSAYMADRASKKKIIIKATKSLFFSKSGKCGVIYYYLFRPADQENDNILSI